MKIIDFNEVFSKYFVRKLTFMLGDSVLKSGKLRLLSTNDFNLKFLLEQEDGKNKSFELPYPFDIIDRGNEVVFKYTIKTLKLIDVDFKLKLLVKNSKSPLYNNNLIIKIE